MEEKILKKLDDMSSQFQLQLQGINQRFDKVEKKIEETEEKIITTEDNITKEIDKKIKTTEDNITKEIDRRLKITEDRIIEDASNALRENIDFLNDKKNAEQEKIVNELREYKVKTLKGVRAFEKVLMA